MIKSVSLKRKDGKIFDGELKVLDKNYLDKIMKLQKQISEGLTIKEWYSESSREEFDIQLNKIGKIVGCVLPDDTLIAMGVYVQWGLEEHNYGYDLDMAGDEVLDVGQIEATLVHENFRGNGLQRIICMELEKIATENKNKIIAATVHPDNQYSLKTFINLGYEIKKEKLKYGGLTRFILSKSIKMDKK